MNLLVGVYRMKVDMKNAAFQRVMLHLLDKGEPIGDLRAIRDLQLDKDMLADRAGQQSANFARGDLQIRRFVRAAVDDRRNEALALDLLDRVAARLEASLRR